MQIDFGCELKVATVLHLRERDFDFEQAMEVPNTLMGNYVLLDHLNGEYSVLAHLKQGSVSVQQGATVDLVRVDSDPRDLHRGRLPVKPIGVRHVPG